MKFKDSRDSKYSNPDNDPRGRYLLTDVTTAGDRPSLRYEWHGQFPPQGRSWRFSKEQAEKLERDGLVVFSASGRPHVKRYLCDAKEKLQRLLHGLATEAFENELEFTRRVIPSLTEALDYDEQETFYQLGKDRYRADVVLSKSIVSKPWVVIEVKRARPRNLSDWIYQLRRYLNAFDCDMGVVISPTVLILASNEHSKSFDLRTITPEQAEEILLALDRHSQRTVPVTEPLTRGTLIGLIESVESAETNQAKGRSLEELAQFLFDRTSSLYCKYRNLQTRSSEIDLVIEYDRSTEVIPLFEELGRYCLVECKNWSKPVGVGPLRDFLGKLDKCKIKLGVIFSKNGVTGVDAGADALREIQSRFDRDGVFVLVFSLEDIRRVSDGRTFLKALDEKADSLRFDAQCY